MPSDYDRVPYRSHPYLRTHPDAMAVAATLFGREPAPIESARVLEIGCGAGGNLLPMAAALPGAHFVGIDPAETAIAAARDTARALGLANVDLRPIGVEDLIVEEPFDYVVAHGVLSWVPPAARAALWRVLERGLSPRGVAYLSFNAFPGWAFRDALRRMMRWHVRDLDDPAARVAGARELLGMLCAANPPTTEWGTTLHGEQRRLDGLGDWYVFHDHLAEHNQPFWFWEVDETARAHGLAFLAEVELPRMVPGNLPPAARDALPHLATSVEELEQYMDLVRMQSFREALWVRADGPPLVRPLDPEHLAALSFTARVQRVEGRWRTLAGVGVTTEDPLADRVLEALAASRGPVPFAALASLGEPRAVAGVLVGALLGHEVVRAHRWPRRWAGVLSRTPEVWPYARLEAERGGPHVTNLLHEVLPTDELDRAVLRLLDGTRDRAALVAALGTPLDEERLRSTLVRAAQGSLLVR